MKPAKVRPRPNIAALGVKFIQVPRGTTSELPKAHRRWINGVNGLHAVETFSNTEEADVSYELDIGLLLIKMRGHFFDINRDQDLTEADKKQLKDFYLQNMIAPKARKLLEKHFPEEFDKPAPSRAATRPSPPTQTADERSFIIFAR